MSEEKWASRGRVWRRADKKLSEVGRGGFAGRDGLEDGDQTGGRAKEVRGQLEGWEK